MKERIRLRRDLSNNWLSNNPILASGEPGVELDTNRFKIGNGNDEWKDLPYMLGNLSGLQLVIGNGQANGLYWNVEDRLNIKGSGGTLISFDPYSNSVVVYSNSSFNAGILNYVPGQTPSGLLLTTGQSGLLTISSGIFSSSITDFNNSVSGLLPVKSIVAGSGVSVSSNSGTFTISSLSTNTISDTSFSNCGRLSLVSNSPIATGNIISSNIYFTPYLGNKINLYDNILLQWKSYTFNEISLSLSSMTNSTNYDIFIYYDTNNFILEKLPWSSNSSRSTNIVYKDGVLVRSDSFNKRYVGTIRATSSTTTEDSLSRRFVFNVNNQISKLALAYDSVSHTYTSSTVRSYRNNTTVGSTRIELINGIDSPIDLICSSYFATESSSSSVGIGIDTTGTFNTQAINTTSVSSGPALILTNSSSDSINLSSGYHYLQLLQKGSSITTFYNALMKVNILC